MPGQRHLYASAIEGDADIASSARSTYSLALRYGERADRLYPVRARGVVDLARGYVDQRFTARALPIAGAVNFVVNSSSLRFDAGMLHDVAATGYALPDPAAGGVRPQFAASGTLDGGRLSIAGVSAPVEAVRGPIDVDGGGLVTLALAAKLVGVPVTVSGAIYANADPRVRISVRGAGDVTQLRTAFASSRRLPMRGPLSFNLLVEGRAAKPLTWIALRSPGVTYASAPLDRLDGLVAFDGREADVVSFAGGYRGVAVSARGRIALEKQRNALEVMLDARAPSAAIPYAGAYLPPMPLDAVALATANDPKAIALRGVLAGSGAASSLDGTFAVDERGDGSIGPIRLRQPGGSLYARVALARNRALAVGLVRANDLAVPGVHASVSASLFGGQSRSRSSVTGIVRARSPFGLVSAQGTVAARGSALEGGVTGTAGGVASFGAGVAGTPGSPRVAGALVVAGGSYRDLGVNGNAALAYADGTIRLRNAAVALGPLFVAATGVVTDVIPNGRWAPRYDVTTEVHTSDVSALVAQARPRDAALVQGSLDANLRIRGAGSSAAYAGYASLPEGSVNGLAFRDFHGAVSGDRSALSLNGASVTVGSTRVAMEGSASTALQGDVAVSAPYADLSDFNDFFDRGDTLAGIGSLSLRATIRDRRLAASSGNAFFAGARYRQLALGTVAARWHGAGGSIDTNVSVTGPTGNLHVNGSLTPGTSSADVRAQASDVDLGTWLPMLGFYVPLTGRLNGEATLAGRLPDASGTVHGALVNGTVGRLPIERFEVRASAARGRATLESAVLDLPSLATQASGSFELRPGGSFSLAAHSTSANVGAFLNQAAGKDFGLAGTLDSELRLTGTQARPHVSDALVLQALRYGGLTIPRVAASVGVDRTLVSVSDGEVDLTAGKAFVTAAVPIQLHGKDVGPGRGPVSASLRAEGVRLSNFLALLPKGTQMDGRIDGELAATGTFDAPQLRGSFALRDGVFSGPMERSPIKAITADLSFAGTSASLTSNATVGGGSLTAAGTAAIANLRAPADATFSLQAHAANARLDLPDYFRGVLDANVFAVREHASQVNLSGDATFSDARIPLTAFLNAKGGGQPQQGLPNVGFSNLRVTAGNNVRVQNANVDIGATGDVVVNGTLAAPALDGAFRATGGSLSFYRSFNVQSGSVSFQAASGLIPDVDAVATTYVADPATAIRLHATGPATSMNLTFASDPSYSREQILGLLVGAQQFGAVRGVNASRQNASFGSAAQQFALGQVNTLFTRAMLEPLSASVASALGFSNVQITSDIQTGLGVNAMKALGKNVNAVFSQSFGYPSSQSVAIEVQPDPATGLRFVWYTSTGASLVTVQQQAVPVANGVLNLNQWTQLPPPTGTNGVAFSYVRKFP